MTAATKIAVLGRSVHHGDQSGSDRLLAALEHLDALLAVVSNQDFDSENGGNDFQRFNNDIQRSVLGLAADLAWEAHSLYAGYQASTVNFSFGDDETGRA